MAIDLDLDQPVIIRDLFNKEFNDINKSQRDAACLAFQGHPKLDRKRRDFEGLPWTIWLVSYFQLYAVCLRRGGNTPDIYDKLVNKFYLHAGENLGKRAGILLPEKSVLELLANEVMTCYGLDPAP